MRALTISLVAGILVFLYLIPEREIKRPPGILVSDEPRQGAAGEQPPFERNGYRIAPMASFSIRARVIFKERYSMGREADISPLDLTVGWGLMSDTDSLARYELSRGYRRFWLKPRTPEAAGQMIEVNRHTANIHVIPATEDLARQLEDLQAGSIIAMGGMLVRVEAKDGWSWRSSLSRDDIGDGACELMWVERLESS